MSAVKERKDMPLFSIITTCRNAADCISGTIESVLSQDHRDFEYIVMDGASDDDTANIARSYTEAFEKAGIDYAVYIEIDHGIYEGMNNALAHANGDYVNFMNADDRLADSHTLTEIAGVITAANSDGGQAPGIFYGDCAAVEFGQTYRFIKDISVIEKKMPFSHQSVFASRELLTRFPFDESNRIASDYGFLLDAYTNGVRFYDLGIRVCRVTLDGLSSLSLLNTFTETVKVQRQHGIDLYPGKLYDRKIKTLKIKQFVMDHFPKCVIMMIRKMQRIHRGQNEHC